MMKRLILLSWLIATPCLGQDSPPSAELPEYRVFGEAATPEDAEALTEVLMQFGEAWGSSDAEAVAAVFTDDAEWTNSFGTTVRGADELADHLGRLFSEYSDTAYAAKEETSYRPVSMRYVGDDAAIVHGMTRSTRGEARSGEGERRVRTTTVLAKANGEWRIVHQMIMDERE
jgi:uncharacterized protein (TIGR02246 family)